MKNLVKWVSLLTALLMLIGCLPLSAMAESQEEVTLTLWSIWSSDSESNKAPFLKTIEEFKAAYPNIDVELDMSEAEAYKTKIKTAVAANEARTAKTIPKAATVVFMFCILFALLAHPTLLGGPQIP